MDKLVRNHFERERERISRNAAKEIGAISAQMAARGIYYGGAHVMAVFKIHEDACRQIVGALVASYKIVAQETVTPPTDVTIAEARSELDAAVKMKIRQIRQEMATLTQRTKAGPILSGEVERLAGVLETSALTEGLREIEIWSETETRKHARSLNAIAVPPRPNYFSIARTWWRKHWPSVVTNTLGTVIGGLILAYLIRSCAFQPQSPGHEPILAPQRSEAPAPKFSPMAKPHGSAPPQPSQLATPAVPVPAKESEVNHLSTMQHIDRSIEDGRAALADAQRLFEQKVSEGKSNLAQRGLSASSAEVSVVYIAQQAGDAKVDEAKTKVKREIEDQLVQYGLTISQLNQLPWLQAEGTAYIAFLKEAESTKVGMASAVAHEKRILKSHL